MDQMKIGGFIAAERKMHGWTQRQLAERLCISDKTVSKWERGNGFPEVSLLLPLCEALEISVNELLAGERVPAEAYRSRAEENMVEMITEREINRNKARYAIATGIIATVAFVAIICTVVMCESALSEAAKAVLFILAFVLFGAGIAIAAEGERTIGYYRCGSCGKYFVPTASQYIMGMHLITTRRLPCPHCGKRSWCRKVLSKD